MKLALSRPVAAVTKGGCLVLWAAASHAPAQNLVANADFSANATSFTAWPGYNNIGGNPSIAGWSSGPNLGLNGTGTGFGTVGSPFQPVNNTAHYAFIQGDYHLWQTVGMTAGQRYLFSFEGASRADTAANPSGVRVFANSSHATPNLELNGSVVGSSWLSHVSFQRYAFAFTANTGPQAFQFSSVGSGDHTTLIDNVSVTPAGSAIAVPAGTTFFTDTSGTVAQGFSLPGGQIFFQRPGTVTYTGNITGTGNGGNDAWSIHSAGHLAGAANLILSGSTIDLGNKVLSIRGNMAANAGNVNSVADANNQMATFHNASLVMANSAWVAGGALKFSGNSGVYIGGSISQHGAGSNWSWGSLILQDNATVYVAGGIEFNNVGANLAFNGGTLTTPSIWGNHFDNPGGGRTIFNGTRIVANQSNSDFLKVSVNFDEAATNGTAHVGSGGAIFDSQAHDLTIAPTLADLPGNNGKLQKFGTGSLSLNGSNSYSGGTTVSQGKLMARNPNALGTGAVTVSNGGSVLLCWNTGSAAYSKDLVVNGLGAPSLVGTGTTSAIYAGEGFSEFTLSGKLTLATSSSLGARNDLGIRVTGQITGAGGLTKGMDRADENGILVLANSANNYAGDTSINKGTIRLAASEVIPHGTGFGNVGISAGTVLDLAGFSETINGLSGSGNVTLGGGSLTVGAGNIASSFGGVISGSGSFGKTGTGTLTLSGNSSSFPGSTSVSNGKLAVTGSLGSAGSSVTVAASGTLGGTGTVAGAVTAAGVLAPGTTGTGTLTTGAVALTGTYACQIEGANSDRLASSGSLTLTGATLAISTLSSPTATSYVIATFTGATPSFTTVTGLPAGYVLDTSTAGQIKLTTRYSIWAAARGLTGGNNGKQQNPEGDSLTNLIEYAFGTDPLVSTGGVITYSAGTVTSTGSPTTSIVNNGNSVDFRAVFGRRKDHAAAGLVYTVQFSAGLDQWVTSSATPAVLATGTEVDAVSVPYPLFIMTSRGVEKPTFFRVTVTESL